jgi:4-carboxymuconolactone decarboxylase
MIVEETLTEAQGEVYRRIVSGPRGHIVGPLRVALHSPELADRWQAFGEFLRYRTSLEPQISELAIIIVGRFWNSQLEWLVHADIAQKSGVSKALIEDIRLGRPPRFVNDREACVYEFTRELLAHSRVAEDTYVRAWAELGTVTLVELTALVGYYSMVAMMLNAHKVPLPASDMAALEGIDDVDLIQPAVLPPSSGVAVALPAEELQ